MINIVQENFLFKLDAVTGKAVFAHATKACEGVVIAALILNISTGWR